MIQTSLGHASSCHDDGMVEVHIPASYLVPDCIADAGRVRQGGLHYLLPWFIATIMGGGA